MVETAWRWCSSAAPEREQLALLTYLPLSSRGRIPSFLFDTARIRRQLRTSPGLIGYSLRAEFAAGRFWTLSAWQDEAALATFVATPPHAAVMQALAPHMGRTRFVRWRVKGAELPLVWDAALARGAEP